MSRRVSLRSLPGTVLGVLVLGVWVVASIFPFYWNVVAAFLPVDRIFASPPNLFPSSPTTGNFRDLTEAIPTIWRNIANTLVLAVAIPLVNVFLGTLAGFAFAKLQFRGRAVLFYVIVGTLAVPSLVGAVPLFLEMNKLGLTDTLWAVFLPSLGGAFGIFLFRQTMESVPDELFDSARVDGATNFQMYRLVAFPLVIPMVITQFIVGFLNVFNDYFLPLIMLRSPENYTFPLALGSIQGQMFASPWGQIMAGALLLMIPAIVLFAFLSRFIVPNTTAGALKG
jgi:ABC-type glycerol-3-phosphate transport system permease component